MMFLITLLASVAFASTPPVPLGLPSNNIPIHQSTVQLINPNGEFVCSAEVFDNNYAVTAAHCLVGDMFGGIISHSMEIRNSTGGRTGVLARAIGLNDRVDFGVLFGDFSTFEKSKLDTTSARFLGGATAMQTCGFPFGQDHLSCVPFTPIENAGFHVRGKGALVPGMSGGPVIDVITKEVIGVNSAVGDGAVYVTPLLGFYGAFGLRRAK